MGNLPATEILTEVMAARKAYWKRTLPHHEAVLANGVYLKVAEGDGFVLKPNPSLIKIHRESIRFRWALRRLGVPSCKHQSLLEELLFWPEKPQLKPKVSSNNHIGCICNCHQHVAADDHSSGTVLV